MPIISVEIMKAQVKQVDIAQVNLYTKKDFKSSGIGSLYEKYILILNEVKTSLMF